MSIGVQVLRLRWALVGIFVAAVPALASPLFKLTDLGAPGGQGWSYAIDANGTICGTSIGTQGGVVPTIFDHGKVTVLVPFPGARDQEGVCTGISAMGLAAGSAYDENGRSRGFIWDGTAYTIIPQLSGDSTVVLGMNAAGEVVGGSLLDSNVDHAFVYRNGQLVDLGAMIEGGNSAATAINSIGEIVGYGDAPGIYITHAFLDRNDRMKDLGDLGGGTNSQGFAINDKGQIAALVWPSPGSPYSVIVNKGKVKTIPDSTNTEPKGINAAGHVVGDTMGSTPWFYDGKKLFALQAILRSSGGWQLQSADALNDSDSIAATAISPSDGLDHAVLLTRIK